MKLTQIIKENLGKAALVVAIPALMAGCATTKSYDPLIDNAKINHKGKHFIGTHNTDLYAAVSRQMRKINATDKANPNCKRQTTYLDVSELSTGEETYFLSTRYDCK